MITEQIRQRKFIKKAKRRKALNKHRRGLMQQHGIQLGSALYSQSRVIHGIVIQRKTAIRNMLR